MRVTWGGGKYMHDLPPHRELGVHVPCVPPPVPTPMIDNNNDVNIRD